MSIVADSETIPLEVHGSREAPEAQPESAWRLIALALGCIVLAFAVAEVSALMAGMIVGLFKNAGAPMNAVNARIFGFTAGALGAASVFIVSALARGRTVGHGNRSVGLANVAIKRLPIIASLAAAIAAYTILMAFALYRTNPAWASHWYSVGLWLAVFSRVTFVIVPSLSEELFFRGWLWTGLRKHWGPLPTAAFTGVLWAAIHIDGGLLKPVILLPVALLLSAARHFGDSVRASIALHALFNLINVISPWLLRSVGLI